MTILLLIKIFLLSWFITHNDYIQTNLLLFVKHNKNIITLILLDILSCCMCLSFWITFIITFNFWIACLVSFISFILIKNNKPKL
jgi:hypothetical protein